MRQKTISESEGQAFKMGIVFFLFYTEGGKFYSCGKATLDDGVTCPLPAH